MIRSLLVTLLVLLMVGAAAAVEAAAFVYVAVPPPACAVVSPCDPPVVFVVDTASGAVVKRFFLPIHTTPEGIAISPNGAHVYVSNRASDGFGQTSITVIDARRHTLVASYAIGAAGKLAIRGDDSRVFILESTPTGGTLHAFDTTTHTIVDSVATLPGVASASSTALDRVFVLSGESQGSYQVDAYNAGTLDSLGTATLPSLRTAHGMSLSRDGLRLHVLMDIMRGFNPTTAEGLRVVLDPATLATVTSLPTPPSSQAGGDPIESTPTDELLAVALNLTDLRRFPLASTGMTSVTLPGEGLAIAVPPAEATAFVTTRPHPAVGGLNALVRVNLANGSIVQTVPLTAATRQLTTTPAGAQACGYRLDSGYASFAVGGGSNTIRLSTACEWEAFNTESWVRLSATAGSATQTNRAVRRPPTPHAPAARATETCIDEKPPTRGRGPWRFARGGHARTAACTNARSHHD